MQLHYMSFGQFLSIVRARWRSATIVFVLILAVAATVNTILPKKFTATASVVVDVKSPELFSNSGAGLAPVMATQVDMMSSERVALKAIKSLQLDKNPDARAQWLAATEGRGEFESWLASFLLKNLDVRPSLQSNVLTATYTSESPEFAAAMANAIVQGYIATTLELRVEPARQFSSFFDERAKALRDKLEVAQARLSAYQRERGLLATDERYDIESTRLNELSSQLVTLQALAAESSGRESQVAKNSDRLTEVLNNPLISGLSADASRQEARLEEMSARLGERHPQVVEVKANIDELRRRISLESARVSGSLGVNDRISQMRVGQVQAALSAQKVKVLKMKQERDEAQVLQRDVESAQRSYETVLGRASQTSLESQNTQTNVSLLKRATEPPYPLYPRVLLNMAVAVIIGILLALLTALLRELFDRKLRSAADVTGLLGQTLIGDVSFVPMAGAHVEKRLLALRRT